MCRTLIRSEGKGEVSNPKPLENEVHVREKLLNTSLVSTEREEATTFWALRYATDLKKWLFTVNKFLLCVILLYGRISRTLLLLGKTDRNGFVSTTLWFTVSFARIVNLCAVSRAKEMGTYCKHSWLQLCISRFRRTSVDFETCRTISVFVLRLNTVSRDKFQSFIRQTCTMKSKCARTHTYTQFYLESDLTTAEWGPLSLAVKNLLSSALFSNADMRGYADAIR